MFKPIKYNGSYYVDGGLTGGYLLDATNDNYLEYGLEDRLGYKK